MVYRIIRELRRRKVFRAAGYYLIGAWGLLQVGDVSVEPAGLPAWVMTALLYLVIVGFPLAMYVGWRYDFTEHGIVRTRKASDGEVDSVDLSLKADDYLMFTALVAKPNSIAVLPFADISRDKDQEYLGDGISETVLHVLSQITGLTVTARTSSFSFKNQNLNVRDIASQMLKDLYSFKDYRDDPEFLGLVDRQAEKVAAQRQWYEELKDEPLH